MRDKNLNPHLVRVVGHAGKPQLGIAASRRRTHKSGIPIMDVIVTSFWDGAPVERITVRSSWVTTVSPVNSAAIPASQFEGILLNLVIAGALTKAERRALINTRKRVMRAELKDRTRITWYWERREKLNMGAGQLTRSFIAAHGLWR